MEKEFKKAKKSNMSPVRAKNKKLIEGSPERQGHKTYERLYFYGR